MIIYLILILLILVLGHFFYRKSLKKIVVNSNTKQFIIFVRILLLFPLLHSLKGGFNELFFFNPNYDLKKNAKATIEVYKNRIA